MRLSITRYSYCDNYVDIILSRPLAKLVCHVAYVRLFFFSAGKYIT